MTNHLLTAWRRTECYKFEIYQPEQGHKSAEKWLPDRGRSDGHGVSTEGSTAPAPTGNEDLAVRQGPWLLLRQRAPGLAGVIAEPCLDGSQEPAPTSRAQGQTSRELLDLADCTVVSLSPISSSP